MALAVAHSTASDASFSAAGAAAWDAAHSLTGVASASQGGTGIAFFTAAGPTVARTYTFPDANATILYEGGTIGATTPNTGAFTAVTVTKNGGGAAVTLQDTAGSGDIYTSVSNTTRTARFGCDSSGGYVWVTGANPFTVYLNSAQQMNLTTSLWSLASGITAQFGTNTAKGAEAFASYITINDSGGTARKVMVCA